MFTTERTHYESQRHSDLSDAHACGRFRNQEREFISKNIGSCKASGWARKRPQDDVGSGRHLRRCQDGNAKRTHSEGSVPRELEELSLAGRAAFASAAHGNPAKLSYPPRPNNSSAFRATEPAPGGARAGVKPAPTTESCAWNSRTCAKPPAGPPGP